MSKRVAVLQSNYIPWKGYFDIIRSVDEFIFYDEVQYTKNDWRNRNKIKCPEGTMWLTIPVRQESLEQKISETKVTQMNWAEKHWKSIALNYAKAAHFKTYKDIFEKFYLSIKTNYLSEVNYEAIALVNGVLNINTKLTSSSDYKLVSGKNERLIDLLKQSNTTHYYSGPSAKSYIDENLFKEANIEIVWMNYSYPEYPQLHPPFEHGVSVLDLIFNTGPSAMDYINK